MKYYVSSNVHIVEVPVKDFKIRIVDTYKKSAYKPSGNGGYINAGYFGNYSESNPKQFFTLPAGNLKADYAADAGKVWEKYYCESRGTFEGDKYTFDAYGFTYQNQFCGRTTTNLVIYNGKANILDINHATDVHADYLICGVPIMRYGKDIKYNPYVINQGWNSSVLYATWHAFVGLKSDSADTIYVMGWKSTTSNMITSAEAYNKFKSLGFYNVIKLDGGGSFHLNVGGKVVATTSENRQINNIITFDSSDTVVSTVTKDSDSSSTKSLTSQNPYPRPTRSLYKGCKGNDVKWLQWMLYKLGFGSGTIGSFVDGSFGSGTKSSVARWQSKNDLVADGSFGPASRAKMLTF